MKKVEVKEIANIVFEKIPKGFFLTTGNGSVNNTMTIGWGGLQVMHSKDCFLVPVRESRYTYSLLNQNPYFTISIPLHDMKEQLKFAGTKSGRDTNKWLNHGLSSQKSQVVNIPIVKECELHLECKVISFADMVDESIEKATRSRNYPDGNLHRFYIGEIVACYYTDKE